MEPVVGVLVREWQLRAADALRVEQQVALGVLHGLRHPLVEERRRGGAGLGHGAQEREKKKEEKKVTTIMTTRCFYTVYGYGSGAAACPNFLTKRPNTYSEVLLIFFAEKMENTVLVL